MNYAVIFAGGVGARMGSQTPKQFLEVDEKPILIHTVEHFSKHPMIDGVVIVSKEDYIEYCYELIEKFCVSGVLKVLPGGETGQQSIYNGVNYLYQNVSQEPERDIVLIHDGVRPLIDEKLITDSITCTMKNGNSIAVARAIETIIRVDADGMVADTVDRSECRYAKAPQCFYLCDIWEAHQRAIQEGKNNIIDSATLMSMYGHELFTVECREENIKVTTPNDYYMFKAMFEARKKGEAL